MLKALCVSIHLTITTIYSVIKQHIWIKVLDVGIKKYTQLIDHSIFKCTNRVILNCDTLNKKGAMALPALIVRDKYTNNTNTKCL